MRRVTRIFTLLVVVAAMALGVALPAAAQDSNPLCTGLAASDCQLLVGGRDALSGLKSFTSPEWLIDLNFTDGKQSFVINATGQAAFVLPQDGTSGLLVHLVVDSFNAAVPDEEPQSGSVEVIVTDTMAFVNWKGEWYGQELSPEDLDTGSLAAINPETWDVSSSFDLQGSVTTTRGADETILGQNTAAFTTDVDITGFLMAVLTSPAFGQALGAADMGDTGMTPEDVQMLGMFLGPMLQGTTLSFTQWVGQDNGQLRQVALNLGLNLDISAFDPETQPITGALIFRAQVDKVNEPYDVPLPENYRPMDDLDSELGSLDLGL